MKNFCIREVWDKRLDFHIQSFLYLVLSNLLI